MVELSPGFNITSAVLREIADSDYQALGFTPVLGVYTPRPNFRSVLRLTIVRSSGVWGASTSLSVSYPAMRLTLGPEDYGYTSNYPNRQSAVWRENRARRIVSGIGTDTLTIDLYIQGYAGFAGKSYSTVMFRATAGMINDGNGYVSPDINLDLSSVFTNSTTTPPPPQRVAIRSPVTDYLVGSSVFPINSRWMVGAIHGGVSPDRAVYAEVRQTPRAIYNGIVGGDPKLYVNYRDFDFSIESRVLNGTAIQSGSADTRLFRKSDNSTFDANEIYELETGTDFDVVEVHSWQGVQPPDTTYGTLYDGHSGSAALNASGKVVGRVSSGSVTGIFPMFPSGASGVLTEEPYSEYTIPFVPSTGFKPGTENISISIESGTSIDIPIGTVVATRIVLSEYTELRNGVIQPVSSAALPPGLSVSLVGGQVRLSGTVSDEYIGNYSFSVERVVGDEQWTSNLIVRAQVYTLQANAGTPPNISNKTSLTFFSSGDRVVPQNFSVNFGSLFATDRHVSSIVISGDIPGNMTSADLSGAEGPLGGKIFLRDRNYGPIVGSGTMTVTVFNGQRSSSTDILWSTISAPTPSRFVPDLSSLGWYGETTNVVHNGESVAVQEIRFPSVDRVSIEKSINKNFTVVTSGIDPITGLLMSNDGQTFRWPASYQEGDSIVLRGESTSEFVGGLVTSTLNPSFNETFIPWIRFTFNVQSPPTGGEYTGTLQGIDQLRNGQSILGVPVPVRILVSNDFISPNDSVEIWPDVGNLFSGEIDAMRVSSVLLTDDATITWNSIREFPSGVDTEGFVIGVPANLKSSAFSQSYGLQFLSGIDSPFVNSSTLSPFIGSFIVVGTVINDPGDFRIVGEVTSTIYTTSTVSSATSIVSNVTVTIGVPVDTIIATLDQPARDLVQVSGVPDGLRLERVHHRSGGEDIPGTGRMAVALRGIPGESASGSTITFRTENPFGLNADLITTSVQVQQSLPGYRYTYTELSAPEGSYNFSVQSATSESGETLVAPVGAFFTDADEVFAIRPDRRILAIAFNDGVETELGRAASILHCGCPDPSDPTHVYVSYGAMFGRMDTTSGVITPIARTGALTSLICRSDSSPGFYAIRSGVLHSINPSTGALSPIARVGGLLSCQDYTISDRVKAQRGGNLIDIDLDTGVVIPDGGSKPRTHLFILSNGSVVIAARYGEDQTIETTEDFESYTPSGFALKPYIYISRI